jgi:hypothetical protein
MNRANVQQHSMGSSAAPAGAGKQRFPSQIAQEATGPTVGRVLSKDGTSISSYSTRSRITCDSRGRRPLLSRPGQRG